MLDGRISAIPDSGMKELLLWFLRLRRRYCVTGASMSPWLESGDEVLVDPGAYGRQGPRPGDVVVARHPGRRDLTLIKRVVRVAADGRYYLEGDNPDAERSSDSRSFGPVPLDHILGRVTSRFG